MAETTLVFFVNGIKNSLLNPDPEMTLLQYLRSTLQLTGTKLACGVGGCGACTVMVSSWSPDSETTRHYSCNACLTPLCSLHGKSVTTVEGIGSLRTRLHPLQELIAANHGTQCGFCTPGFVMSMYALLRNNPTPSMQQVNAAFEGNLCRCTGYRPILDAYRPLTQDGVCAMGDACCRNNATSSSSNQNRNTAGESTDRPSASDDTQNGNADTGKDGISSKTAVMDSTQEPIFPPALKLAGKDLNSQSLVFAGPRVTWFRPVSLAELLDIKKRHPQCQLVAGNTKLGVDAKVKNRLYPVLVSTTHVPELTTIRPRPHGLQLGASVTLASMETALNKAIGELPEEKTRFFSAFVEMLRWFGGQQIRNVATLGGNIMAANSTSDLCPLLLACGAVLEFVSTGGIRREVKMDGSFFKGEGQTDMGPGEILLSVSIPLSHKNEFVHAYKQATRKENDTSIVNAALRVAMDTETEKVRDLTLAFGGVAPTTIMATSTMATLIGRTWDSDLLDTACDLLTSDLHLDPGSPGGDVEFRSSLAVSFFFKFYLTVLKQIEPQAVGKTSAVSSRDHGATVPLERGPSHSLRWYEEPPSAESNPQSPSTENGALRRPLVHESAYKQATGEAVYIDDIPPRKGELYLALVLSSQARAGLVRVEPGVALAMPGVVDYVCHRDVPASNTWSVMAMDAEEIFASEQVVHQGQVIGAILADTLTNAQRAAQAVEVHYDAMEPVITIADAIENDSFYPYDRSVACGDVDGAMSQTDVVVMEGEVHVEAQEHFYLEPQASIAYPTEDRGMEMVCSAQSLTVLQSVVADTLGVSRNKIKCIARRLGGGFGGKESRFVMNAVPTAVAANKHNCPVRCVLEREEDMRMTGTRHPFLGKYKIGLDPAGKIVAYDVQFYINAGSSLDLSPAVADKALLEAASAYHIPNFRAVARLCRTNLPSCTAFRGFGAPQALVVLETALTHAAVNLALTPEKVRQVNLCQEGDVIPAGATLTQCTMRRCWEDVLQQSQFTQRRQDMDRFNSENRWRKRGISIVPVRFGMSFPDKFLNQGAALVNIYTDGTVLISHGGVEMGQGLHIKVMQVASQALNVPVSMIQVSETSTSVIPNSSPTASSVSSDLYGEAVLNACTVLVERLKPLKDLHPDYTWQQLIFAAYFDRISLSATGFCSPKDVGYDFASRQGAVYNYFTYGSAVSEVELDCLTGDHQVLSTHIVMDVGRSLNPAIDIGQIEGAFMQGHGLMVLEQYKVQKDGTLLSQGPDSYKIPSAGNIPQVFNVTLLRESGNPKAVYSSKGIGEPPLLLGASVLFAIHDAVKSARLDEGLTPFVRLDTPATPAHIRLACSDRFTQLCEDSGKTGNKQPWFVDL